MNTRTNTTKDTANKRPLTYILWTIQILLTLLFLFAGIVKLIMPIATLTQQSKLPGMLFRFVAVAEVLGALGLILPGFFRIRTGLTPLAAAGLVIIMIGATVDTMAEGSIGLAVLPFITLLLSAFVAYGRWRLAPLPSRTNR